MSSQRMDSRPSSDDWVCIDSDESFAGSSNDLHEDTRGPGGTHEHVHDETSTQMKPSHEANHDTPDNGGNVSRVDAVIENAAQKSDFAHDVDDNSHGDGVSNGDDVGDGVSNGDDVGAGKRDDTVDAEEDFRKLLEQHVRTDEHSSSAEVSSEPLRNLAETQCDESSDFDDEDAFEGEWGDGEDKCGEADAWGNDEDEGEKDHGSKLGGGAGSEGEAELTLRHWPRTLKESSADELHEALEASSMPIKFPSMLQNKSVPPARSEFDSLRESYVAAKHVQRILEMNLAKQNREFENAQSDVEVAAANFERIRQRKTRTEVRLNETLLRLSELRGAFREALQANNTAVVCNKIKIPEQKESVERAAAFQDSYKLGVALNQSGIYAGEGAMDAVGELSTAHDSPNASEMAGVLNNQANAESQVNSSQLEAGETFFSEEIVKRLRKKARKPEHMLRQDLLEENELFRCEIIRLQAKYASVVIDNVDGIVEGTCGDETRVDQGVANVGDESSSELDADEELAKFYKHEEESSLIRKLSQCFKEDDAALAVRFYQREEDARLARKLRKRLKEEDDAALAHRLASEERAASSKILLAKMTAEKKREAALRRTRAAFEKAYYKQKYSTGASALTDQGSECATMDEGNDSACHEKEEELDAYSEEGGSEQSCEVEERICAE